MGKLYVMVFAFTPAPKTNPAETCTWTPAPARKINPAPPLLSAGWRIARGAA